MPGERREDGSSVERWWWWHVTIINEVLLFDRPRRSLRNDTYIGPNRRRPGPALLSGRQEATHNGARALMGLRLPRVVVA